MVTTKTILIVDDEKPFVSLLQKTLTDRDYDVIVAYDGEQAMEHINASKPDLILLDIRMPKMSGLAVYNRICLPGAGSKPLFPVIVITAHHLMDEVFKNLSIDGFMHKPLRMEELLEKIHYLLSGQAQQDQAKKFQTSKISKKIMLVENMDEIIEKLSMLFLNEGYSVNVAKSGSEAIQQIMGQALPDLVLLRHDLVGSPLAQISPFLRASAEGRDVSLVIYSRDLKSMDLAEEAEIISYVGNKNLADLSDTNSLLNQCRFLLRATPKKKHPIAA